METRKTKEKVYCPKELEVILNQKAIVIRKRLRKLFPEEAKKGAWKITEEMVQIMKGEDTHG